MGDGIITSRTTNNDFLLEQYKIELDFYIFGALQALLEYVSEDMKLYSKRGFEEQIELAGRMANDIAIIRKQIKNLWTFVLGVTLLEERFQVKGFPVQALLFMKNADMFERYKQLQIEQDEGCILEAQKLSLKGYLVLREIESLDFYLHEPTLFKKGLYKTIRFNIEFLKSGHWLRSEAMREVSFQRLIEETIKVRFSEGISS